MINCFIILHTLDLLFSDNFFFFNWCVKYYLLPHIFIVFLLLKICNYFLKVRKFYLWLKTKNKEGQHFGPLSKILDPRGIPHFPLLLPGLNIIHTYNVYNLHSIYINESENSMLIYWLSVCLSFWTKFYIYSRAAIFCDYTKI